MSTQTPSSSSYLVNKQKYKSGGWLKSAPCILDYTWKMFDLFSTSTRPRYQHNVCQGQRSAIADSRFASHLFCTIQKK